MLDIAAGRLISETKSQREKYLLNQQYTMKPLKVINCPLTPPPGMHNRHMDMHKKIRIVALSAIALIAPAQICSATAQGGFCFGSGPTWCCTHCVFVTCNEPEYDCYVCVTGCTDGTGSYFDNCK